MRKWEPKGAPLWRVSANAVLQGGSDRRSRQRAEVAGGGEVAGALEFIERCKGLSAEEVGLVVYRMILLFLTVIRG